MSPVASPVSSLVAEAMSSVPVATAPAPPTVSGGMPAFMAEGMPADLVEDEPAVGTPAWAEMYHEAVTRYQEERERLDREAQEAQTMWDEFLRIQGQEVSEGERSLSQNDGLHRQLLDLARSAQAAEYETDNVIGDPNQTFGIEIEFDGGDPHAIARDLHAAGLSASPSQEGYHSSRRAEGMWTLERDVTVTGEVVSPVLRDKPETWEQLQRVCEILRRHGACVSARTGGHVHVGCDSANLDHDLNRFRRIASVCGWAEDLMYRLAAGSGRGRRHRGADNRYHWCGPMRSGQFEDVQNLQDLSYRVGASHSVGLNYGNILDARRTIEYRYFDSSLDPERLQANIKLACWITRRAAELPDSAIPRERVPLGSHADGRQADDNDQLLRRFADTVFVRPKDKLKLYWLYQRSAWQPLQARAA
jgi:hypothetical protein